MVKQQIPETASSATLACCFTKSSWALELKRAADNFSVRVFTSVTSSGGGVVCVVYTYTSW